jgi:hypothetical protein
MVLLGDGDGSVGGGGASASSLGLVDELVHVPDGFMCRMGSCAGWVHVPDGFMYRMVKLLIENVWRVWVVMSQHHLVCACRKLCCTSVRVSEILSGVSLPAFVCVIVLSWR